MLIDSLMQHSRQCRTSCVVFRAWLFFRIILSVKFERSSQNTKEGTHRWNRRVLFNGTVPQHPIFWQQFIPHDHVDTLVLVEHNDVVCLTFQTIGDVHCLHQIIQRQWTLNEQRKEQHFVNEDIEADRFSSEVFEPKGSINKKIINRSNKFNQTMKSSHNQTTIPHHQVEYPDRSEMLRKRAN